jgi:lysozyme family protein
VEQIRTEKHNSIGDIMKETYERAMQQVYADEGGYSNDVGDPGGPTNYGSTIHDARMYWKPDATAYDVRNMPKSVAADIYDKHYATPLHYNDLPAGVDYAVLDYGINSGISRSARVLQGIVEAKQNGIVGPETLKNGHQMDPVKIINSIYDERLRFLKSLRTWPRFGKGWGARCARGRQLALSMAGEEPVKVVPMASAVGAAADMTGRSGASRMRSTDRRP